MPPKKKPTTFELLQGHTITVVARKGYGENEEEKEKDLPYAEALKARAQFIKLGWRVDLFQKGFYKSSKKNKN